VFLQTCFPINSVQCSNFCLGTFCNFFSVKTLCTMLKVFVTFWIFPLFTLCYQLKVFIRICKFVTFFWKLYQHPLCEILWPLVLINVITFRNSMLFSVVMFYFLFERVVALAAFSMVSYFKFWNGECFCFKSSRYVIITLLIFNSFVAPFGSIYYSY
jgi:hypothetical protein